MDSCKFHDDSIRPGFLNRTSAKTQIVCIIACIRPDMQSDGPSRKDVNVKIIILILSQKAWKPLFLLKVSAYVVTYMCMKSTQLRTALPEDSQKNLCSHNCFGNNTSKKLCIVTYFMLFRKCFFTIKF